MAVRRSSSPNAPTSARSSPTSLGGGAGTVSVVAIHVGCEVRNEKNRVVLFHAQVEPNRFSVLEIDTAGHCEGDVRPLIGFEASMYERVEGHGAVLLAQGVRFELESDRVDVAVYEPHAVGEGFFADDPEHHAAIAIHRIELIAGAWAGALTGGVPLAKAAGFRRGGWSPSPLEARCAHRRS